MRSTVLLWVVIASILIGASCKVTIVKRYPHDSNCYTQGFEFISKNELVESCGMYGQSRVHVRQFDRDKNQLSNTRKFQLSSEVFGEGLTLLNNKLYVLTWRENRVFVLNPSTMEKVRELRWPRQGWGLTNNSTHLFLSDGTPNIFVLDEDLNRVGLVEVRMPNGQRVPYLNELEFYKEGKLLANVFMKNILVLINLKTSKVEQVYDLAELRSEQTRLHELKPDEVLNGLAYNPIDDELLVTGKNWHQIYQVKLE